MAHKTFISYKYSEATALRDRIIEAMGEDATYYNGETSNSPDMSDESNRKIQEYLKDCMYPTSVTIVIISPHMKESHWIDWEITYCLKKIKREGRTSQRNGLVGVIMKVNGSYDWFKYKVKKPDGHVLNEYHTEKVFDIINDNRFNQEPEQFHCDQCKSYDALWGSYISFVEEDTFIAKYDDYVENAYKKSENDAFGYRISIE